jgi:transcriptional regulator GlxA family with amidase domain
LLDNLTVTTFHLSIDDLKKDVPKAKVLNNVRFVDNGKVITTAGISAGIDGALHLVEKIRGTETAKQIAAYMEYDKWVPQQGLVIARAE